MKREVASEYRNSSINNPDRNAVDHYGAKTKCNLKTENKQMLPEIRCLLPCLPFFSILIRIIPRKPVAGRFYQTCDTTYI